MYYYKKRSTPFLNNYFTIYLLFLSNSRMQNFHKSKRPSFSREPFRFCNYASPSSAILFFQFCNGLHQLFNLLVLFFQLFALSFDLAVLSLELATLIGYNRF